MTTHRVAVVVPCHDDGETLPQTLASLEDQEPHELAVVDDGSTDPETLALLERLRAGGVQVVRQENAGLSAARMAGVAATGAPAVLPLDADDALVPGAIAALADALEAHPAAAVAWGDVELFGDVEAPLRMGRRLDAWQLTYLNTLPVASLVRRSALEAAGGWELRYGYEDWDLWLALAERGFEGVHVPRPVLRYRRRGGRMLTGTMARHDEIAADLRRRHPESFERRRRAWLRSRAPLRERLLFPAIDAAPLPSLRKLALYQLVHEPRQFLAVRRRARRAA